MEELLSRYPSLLVAIAGVVLIFWPPPRQPMVERKRQARLAELAHGAAERHFEERRELEAYGPKSAGPYRLGGFLLLGLAAALLLLPR